MSKKELLHKLYANKHLEIEEAEVLMLLITEGKLSEAEIASVLMFYKLNPILIHELVSFRKILLEKCIRFKTAFDAIDVCGTGGDEKDTFNISTLSAIVIAACGYKVIKHGNYGVSSVSGSSNILEHFGYKFTNNQNVLLEQLEQNNICFLHAPLFHPALKQVASVRSQLGTKTIFNLLGPLVNPANIKHQLIGVNSLDTMRKYHYLLQNTEANYCLVHNLDGYDEISLTNSFKLQQKRSEIQLNPNQLGFAISNATDLRSGNSLPSAAKIFKDILNDRSNISQKNVVIANSGFAIQLMTGKNIQDCFNEAKEVIENKKALDLFKNIITKKYEYT